MYIVKPSCEILHQRNGIEGVYEIIETAGKTCRMAGPRYKYYNKEYNKSIDLSPQKWEEEYKEEYPNRGENVSASVFVESMKKLNHTAMLEHGTVYLTLKGPLIDYDIVEKYAWNHYSKVKKDDNNYYITTNYCVIFQNEWEDDLKYMTVPSEKHEKRVSVRFVMDRVGTQSIVRHRHHSFGQESTRYCNYSNDKKYSEGIGISLPVWIDEKEIDVISDENTIKDTLNLVCNEFVNGEESGFTNPIIYWYACNLFCDFTYLKLTELGWTPEKARSILPLDVKSEIVMTGFMSDWNHFFDLRYFGTTGKPHPDINAIAESLYSKFEKEGLIK